MGLKIRGTPPNYANARMHWRVKHISCQLWTNKIMEATRGAPSIQRPKLTLTLYSIKEPDFDNLVSRWKPVIDGLVRSGVIADDKLSVLGQPTFHWVQVSKLDEQRIEVLVEETDL